MDRKDQAVALLRENRSKGLSFYDCRQALTQSGFSDTEIDDATDQLDSQVREQDNQSTVNPPAAAPLPVPSAVAVSQPVPVSTSTSGNQVVVSFDGVESSLSKFVISKLWIVALALIAAAALLFLFKNPVIVIVPLLFFLGYLKANYENGLFEAFAMANNFNYSKKEDGSAAGQEGLIFTIGHNPHYSDIVSGNYKAWGFLLFMYRYTVGYGRNSHTYYRAVMSVNFATPLPSFVLRRHKRLELQGQEGESLSQHGYTQKVELEGDFDDHFRVYIRPDSQVDVLSLLAPDIMQLLMGLDKYELEMTENGVLHIYCHGYITDKQSLMDIYKILEALTGPIGRYANRQKELQQLETQPQVIEPNSSNVETPSS